MAQLRGALLTVAKEQTAVGVSVARCLVGVLAIWTGLACVSDSQVPLRDQDAPAVASPVSRDSAGAEQTISTVRVGEFELHDSISYSYAGIGGDLGYLYHRGILVDTIDRHFGIKPLAGDSILYLQVHTFEEDPEVIEVEGFQTYYVIYYDGKKSALEPRLTKFSDTYSSPEVIGQYIYYWGLTKKHENCYRVEAARFDYVTGAVDTVFLVDDPMGTDYPGYFPRPAADGNVIRYAKESGQYWLLDSEHQIAEVGGSTSRSCEVDIPTAEEGRRDDPKSQRTRSQQKSLVKFSRRVTWLPNSNWALTGSTNHVL